MVELHQRSDDQRGEGDAPAGLWVGGGLRRELCAVAGAGPGGGDSAAGESLEGVEEGETGLADGGGGGEIAGGGAAGCG